MPKKAPRPPSPEASTVMTEDRQVFGSRLATLLTPGTVDAAADWAGVDRSTLYRWRDSADEREPGLFRAVALANYLGITLSELVGDQPLSREPTPYDREPQYRDLISGLESMSLTDRERAIEFIQWITRIQRTPPQASLLTRKT